MVWSGYHDGELTMRRVSTSEDAPFAALLRIYEDAIPASERKSTAQLAAMRLRPEYCFLSATRGGAVIGFAVAARLEGTGAALLEYMAVAAGERGRGVGAELFRATAAQPELAGRYLLIEVDSSETAAADRAERTRRKAFYARLGARELAGVRYRMPQVASVAPPAMDLLVHGAELPATLETARVRRWIACCYAQVYGVADADAAVEAMLAEVGESIPLVSR